MYSIKGTKDIEFNYNISSIRKISDTEYQYHGKPNSPNLVLSNGIKRISYVAERIEMKQKELIIHHSATSNFPKRAMVIFPLVVSKGRETVIDRLLGMEMNETLDLDIGSEITDFTMEINETQKSAYIIRLSGGLPMSEKPVIADGFCGMTKNQKLQLKNAVAHTQGPGPQNHTISSDVFAKSMKKWLDETGQKCIVREGGNDKHYIKDGDGDVSKTDDTITGAKQKVTGDTDITELTNDQCKTIGGELKYTNFGVGGGGGGGSGPSPNQEMECFPNEGGVFNKRFHIIYDTSSNFIAEDGVKIHNDKKKDKTLRAAMNAEVKRLKEHIEKLGGIYVPDATIPEDFTNVAAGKPYKYINIVDNTTAATIQPIATNFFNVNKENEIDIFITYAYIKDRERMKRFSIDKDNIVDKKKFDKPHQAKECILVAVKNGTNPLIMNATQFSEDYLNKDFNRYTHISIPGYMTDTENQSMKAIVYLLAMILTSIVSYYTVPGFYKLIIKRITGDKRTCSLENMGNDFKNYYKVTAFNYFFTIIMVIVPTFIMVFTSTLNGILSSIMIIGLICVLTMIVRFTNDAPFFYDFYPRNGLITCNKTKDFRKTQGYGSKFKVFTYIPSAVSALFSGGI